MFLWRRVARDTGGAGARRGGPGVSSAFAVIHSEHMTGGAYGSCAFVPPRGAQGGYPGSTGGWELFRRTNVVELLADGRLPDDHNLTGQLAPLPAKCGELVFSYGDVFIVTNGGGAGIGDPLLRPPAVVAKDVADGYVSAEAASDIYGVVLLRNTAADEERTEARRRSIREARLEAAPSRAVSAHAELESLTLRDGQWFCALCDERLAATGENWRTTAVVRESDVEARFADWYARVRPRTSEPHIVVREHYCPACASSLGIDVTVAGQPTVVSPSLDA
jgi:N-methylhydantoinase B